MNSTPVSKVLLAAVLMGTLANSGVSSPSPSPTGGIRLSLGATPLSEGEVPEEVLAAASSEKIRALRLRLTNHEKLPARLLWGDFLVRDPDSDKWVGGWWGGDLGIIRKMELLAGSGNSGKPSFIPPLATLEYLMVDSWSPEVEGMEYKFACLVSLPSGETALFETPASRAPTLPVDRSGVELVAAGVSSAVGKLVSPDLTDPPTAPGSLGALLVHTQVGPVEVGKNAQLKASTGKWLPGPSPAGELFHVYRTEVVNNTQVPLRLLMMEAATPSADKWLTGHLRPPVMGTAEIASSSYMEKVGDGGVPKMEKMSDGWLLPGDRMIFPALWHIATPSGSSSSARWRAVLVDREGVPVYAEGMTPSDMPPVPLPSGGGASPSPSLEE